MLKPASRVRPDAYEAVFGALAHPARRRILLTIYFNKGEMPAGEIAAMFAHAWQTTSRHLRVLEAAGLISQAKQGRMRIYRLERKQLALVTEWLAHFQGKAERHAGGTGDVRENQTSTPSEKRSSLKARSA